MKLEKHRIYCETDGQYEYTWLEQGQTLTTCPVNTTHTVTLSSDTVIETQEDQAQKDSDGALLSRQKIAKSGHHYQGMFAVLGVGSGNIESDKKDGTTVGFWSCTRYDASDVVTTNQADAVKSVFEFQASHDIAILGLKLWQSSAPTTSTKIWVQAAPHIPLASGGQVSFLEGGCDLKYMGSGLVLDVDGRAPKDILHDPTYLSHKFELTVKHDVNSGHDVQLEVEYFKPPGV
jgi:hypothetical protein